MITKSDSKKIKNILGSHYTRLVQTELKLVNAKNKYGAVHTSNQIRVVLSGNSSNIVIEKAIFKAVESKKKELDERKNILKNNLITKDEL